MRLLQVIESTGVVVTPYMEYPQLLGMLLHMLSEGSPHARTEVLKVNPQHTPHKLYMQCVALERQRILLHLPGCGDKAQPLLRSNSSPSYVRAM